MKYKFIGNVDNVLHLADCKSIVELAGKTRYHSHYVSAILRGKECSNVMAMKIAAATGLSISMLFEEVK